MRDNTLSITLAPEWVTDPLWIEYSATEPSENAPPESLAAYGVDAELISDIASWDNAFQAIYNSSDPPASEFEDDQVAAAWFDRGITFAGRVSAQLRPGVIVRFRNAGREARFVSPNHVADH